MSVFRFPGLNRVLDQSDLLGSCCGSRIAPQPGGAMRQTHDRSAHADDREMAGEAA